MGDTSELPLSFTLNTDGKTKDTIYLDKSFVLNKMNHIFQRLIGVGDFELTTREPEVDQHGNFTILERLNITLDEITTLVAFLRTGILQPADFQKASKTSIVLGGFLDVDQYIIDHTHKKTHERVRFQQDREKHLQNRLPKCPGEDHQNKFQWIPMCLGHYTGDIIKDGWSATGYIFDPGSNGTAIKFTYFRKQLE